MLVNLIKVINFFYGLRIPMSLTIHFGGDGSFKYEANLKEKAINKLITKELCDETHKGI